MTRGLIREEVRRVRGIMHQLELHLLTLEESEKHSIEYELEEDIKSKKWVMNPGLRYSFQK